MLSLANPVAFSSGLRLKRLVSDLAAELKLPGPWQYEVAALLAGIGCITVPGEILNKYYAGQPLTEAEMEMYRNHPLVGAGLLEKIPRLETVAAIIAHQFSDYRQLHDNPDIDEDISRAAQVLRIAVEYDAMVHRDVKKKDILAHFTADGEAYDQTIVGILSRLRTVDNRERILSLYVCDMSVGMLVEQDILGAKGALIARKGQVVSWSLLQGLSNFARQGGVRQPILVRVRPVTARAEEPAMAGKVGEEKKRGSGPDALARMAEERFEVVVSDMRMPGMDGAELFETVRRLHPHTIRIMLTGHAEEESILRTVGVVHQFLAKPCEPERLKGILLRVTALQDLLADGGVKDLLSRIDKLPALPAIFARLEREMARTDPDINAVGKIIEQDIAMSAKVLQLVNSAFFGLYSKVESPGRAVRLLGLDTVKALVLGCEIFSKAEVPEDILDIGRLWRHSLSVGMVARAIALQSGESREEAGVAFLAGLLHDIGRLILVAHFPQQYRQVVAEAGQKGCSLSTAEMAHFSARHGEVGAYLLGLWGFATPVLEAVAFHHLPELYPADQFSPTLAVHLADILYYRCRPEELVGQGEQFNEGALAAAGLGDRLAAFAEICSEILDRQEGAAP